jgi:hypothetical protein
MSPCLPGDTEDAADAIRDHYSKQVEEHFELSITHVASARKLYAAKVEDEIQLIGDDRQNAATGRSGQLVATVSVKLHFQPVIERLALFAGLLPDRSRPIRRRRERTFLVARDDSILFRLPKSAGVIWLRLREHPHLGSY